MGQDDRPEDERDATPGESPQADVPDEEPEDLAGAQPGPESGAEAAPPDEEPAEATPTAPGVEPEEAPPPEGERPPRRRVLKAFVVLGGVLAVAFLLVGWNRVAASDDFCASCHEVEPAVGSAQRSVHEGVPCLSCHTGPGLLGTLRYLPTLARETIDEFTGWDVAHGVMEARPCESCHTDLAATPELAAAHATEASCASCHGNVSHPPYRLAGFERPVEPVDDESVHPPLYVQTHGDDAVRNADSCVDCHEADYCETCHMRETFPHPEGWISTHGTTQQELGIQACEGCHPQTFCIGCHGTEIPHTARWLGEHWRDLQDAGTEACMLCHPKTDCTECHARHEVHREQDLYV